MIDTTFNFYSDATGPDPDRSSPTLRRYHRLLWSKELPNGKLFTLSEERVDTYLYHPVCQPDPIQHVIGIT